MNNKDTRDKKLEEAEELYYAVQDAITHYGERLKALGYVRIKGGSAIVIEDDDGQEVNGSVPWVLWCHPDYVDMLNSLPLETIYDHQIEDLLEEVVDVETLPVWYILPCFKGDNIHSWSMFDDYLEVIGE